MGTFRTIRLTELRIRKRMGQEDLAFFDQFKGYLLKMDSNDAGIYDFSSGEDRQRSKKLLRMAAKALAIPVRIKDEENSLVFYKRKPMPNKG